MVHIRKKMKKGQPYYHVRETGRIDGKPEVVNQIYPGTVERIRDLAPGKDIECRKLAAREFGALWLANLINAEVGLADLIDSVVARGRRDMTTVHPRLPRNLPHVNGLEITQANHPDQGCIFAYSLPSQK